MTSNTCYVYIQLPGSLEIATCGRYRLDLTEDGTSLGRFVYGQSYLARQDAVPLDPFHLPLATREYQTVKLGGLFGALRDVAPDFWAWGGDPGRDRRFRCVVGRLPPVPARRGWHRGVAGHHLGARGRAHGA